MLNYVNCNLTLKPCYKAKLPHIPNSTGDKSNADDLNENGVL